MKKLSLILILSLMVSLLFSQHHNHFESIESRYENADYVFEGKVIEKIGFWNPQKSQIFTKNIIQINQVFKGGQHESIEIVTQGGEVGDEFQYVFHAKEFQLGSEGLFFCKYFDVPSLSEILMINGQNGFIAFQSGKLSTTGYDQGLTYENIRKEVYSKFQSENNISTTSDNTPTFTTSVTETIEFDWDNLQIIGTENFEFDLYAKSTTGGLPFGGGEVYVRYSTLLSGNHVVSNNNVSVLKKVVIDSDNYDLSISDYDSTTIKIEILADCDRPEDLYSLSSNFEKLCHLSLTILDITQIASLELDGFQMNGQVYYYDSNQEECIPFDDVIVPNDIEEFIVPTIISHDTILTAGTGFMLNIVGTDFDTLKGEVLFRNADTNSGLMAARPEDIVWSDTFIQVRVPSVGNGLVQGGAPPAGSGFFHIRTASPVVDIQSPQSVDILYAVFNFRNASNDALWGYFGENPESDGNENGVLTFRLDSTLQFHAQAKPLIDTALCQWTGSTGVDWELGSVSPVNITADEDSINLIYFAPSNHFFGGSANATAFTKITGARIEPCNPSVRFVREIDIVIREDLTTLNPPILGGYHYNRNTNPAPDAVDFYSVILHELGHAHLLKHALPNSKVMYPFTPPGTHRRSFHANDVEGGETVLDSSSVYLGMFPTCATAIQSGGMCLAVSTKDTFEEEKISAYPNPFYDVINLEIPSLNKFSVIIYNSLGQTVFKQSYQNDLSEFQIGVNENLSPGLYYLTIKSGKKSYSLKLIKL